MNCGGVDPPDEIIRKEKREEHKQPGAARKRLG